MQHESRAQRRDLEYGYPSLERGIQFDRAGRCDSLEILQDGPEFQISQEELEISSLKAWLVNEITTPPHLARGGLRLLLGVCRLDPPSNNRLLPFAVDDFELISQRLQLPEQFLHSMKARIPCAYKVSYSSASTQNQTPSSIRYVFKFSIYQPSYYHLAITYSHSTKVTQALLLSKTNDHQFPVITGRLKTLKQHITHPLLLPIILSEICLSSSEIRMQTPDDRLNSLEELLGQHEWINRPLGDPLKLDFISTTRSLNFISRILATEKMRIQGQLLSLNRILEEVENLYSFSSTHSTEGGETYIWMKETISHQQNTGQYLLFRAEYQEKRVQTQLAVVYQFMTIKDSKVNIQLAKTSGMIASESKKDSGAMKAIAVLTMCFLPGTFLAAIFAMPLFNWDGNDGPRIKAGFKIYWAIAIPLTIGVLGVWILSMFLPWSEWTAGLFKKNGAEEQTSESEMLGLKDD